jgi:hypothetical protein
VALPSMDRFLRALSPWKEIPLLKKDMKRQQQIPKRIHRSKTEVDSAISFCSTESSPSLFSNYWIGTVQRKSDCDVTLVLN